MAESIEERIQKLKEHVPDDKTEQDIRDLIESSGDDEVAIQGKIAEWWEASANAEEEEEEAPPPPPPPAPEPEAPQEEAAPQPPPKPKSDKPKPPKSSSSKPGSGSGVGAGGSGGRDKEMMDFRHLMVKGLELKKAKDGASEKCVIYMDVTCRTLFCAGQKNAPDAKAHRVEDIAEATAAKGNEKIISITLKEGSLDLEVSSPKVRDFLVRMLNKLFSSEKAKAEDAKSSTKPKSSSSSRSDKGEKGGSSSSKSKSQRPSASSSSSSSSSRSGRNQVSQVRLLAEHCYTLSDDAIEEMVTAKIPTHSRWESYQEFKEKIDRRDELIKSLQDGLGTLNGERFRFQRACEDIELHHQDELKELKQHLSMALTSFQELQRASESREGEMREALKGANSRSSMFEQEKSALMESMNNERVNGAVAAKEAEMLAESVTKLTSDLEKKTAEYEDARKRFAQVKDALTVERNLRARAEIQEEKMRQAIIEATGKMHSMKDTFVAGDNTRNKQVEALTVELQGKIDALESRKTGLATELSTATMELEKVKGELDGMQQALSGANAKASELKVLADKAATLPGLKAKLAKLQKDKSESEGASKEELASLIANTKEQSEKLEVADKDLFKMKSVVQELRGNVRVYVRVRPFLKSDEGVDLEDVLSSDSAVKVQADGTTAVLTHGGTGKEHGFKFDKAFAGHATQEDVFAGGVEEMIQSSLDGYHVCVLSWGASGSGKTHTIQGYGKEAQKGFLARSMELVAKCDAEQKAKGWTYKFELTVLEFYNEEVIDLLRDEGTDKEDLPVVANKKGTAMLVTGSNKVEVDPVDVKGLEDLCQKAAVNRATSATDANEQSSRGHMVFTLYLTGTHEDGACVTGILNLCDLAGAETLSGSVDGERAKESTAISKSLSNLADVFHGLKTNASYIPFRVGKLTNYLSCALCGDGKTMLIVTLSPTQDAFDQSLASLTFGYSVNQIELGKAIRNVVEPITETNKKSKTGGGTKKGSADDSADAKGGASKGGKKKK
mmetsp:Transcript_51999/g.104299  ORF Transcript_51999/g.104299 Transcript_51999/m.104299 type:complete len:1014 (-) Transcript_51999:129-3170(-)